MQRAGKMRKGAPPSSIRRAGARPFGPFAAPARDSPCFRGAAAVDAEAPKARLRFDAASLCNRKSAFSMNLRYRRAQERHAGEQGSGGRRQFGMRSKNRNEADRAIICACAAASIPSISAKIRPHSFCGPILMNRVTATWNSQMQEALRGYDLTTP